MMMLARSIFKHHALAACCYFLMYMLFSPTVVAASEAKSDNKKQVDIAIIVNKVKKAILTRDFALLKPYVPKTAELYWAQCNTDVSRDVSLEGMIRILLRNSKNAVIHVNEVPAGGLIETEGWTGEYPYLYFQFTEVGKHWEWLGVCFDINRSLDFAVSLGGKDKWKDKLYDGPPQLPRKGARIFQDEIALRARIEEIVRFKVFDALKPYATKKMLTFGQCNLSMMEKDRIEGKEMPVQDVVNFLKQNVLSTGEIVSSGMQHKTYYETAGWSGEYPFIAFWFSEGSKGWELAGISYCKTRHFDLFPPLSPLK